MTNKKCEPTATMESMIGDAGALLGTCSIAAEHKTLKKKSKAYQPESIFGQWLKSLVDRAVIDAKEKHRITNESIS